MDEPDGTLSRWLLPPPGVVRRFKYSAFAESGKPWVASDITLMVDAGTRRSSALRGALVIMLAAAAMPAQAGSAPREPYPCQLYVDASRQSFSGIVMTGGCTV